MIRNSKDIEDALEYYLESQKQKHYREGALCTLGYILVGSILEAQKEGEIMLPAESHTNYEKNNNADNSAQTSSGTKTECVGTYPVSGYTRADGTEVSGYTRSCGAAHNGKSKPEKAEPIEEPDYFAENEGYDVLEGRVEKNEDVENESQKENNTGSQSYYSNLDEFAKLQKKATQVEFGNEILPLKDYYKISLDLANNPDKVISNDRYQIYKVNDLPSNFNKEIVYQKIAKGMNIDLSNSGRQVFFKDVRVVVPTEDSKLVELIKNSDEIQEILKREKDNILEGKYKNKYLPNGVEFAMPNGKDFLEGQFNDKSTLFGVIHNADIYDISSSKDGNIQFVITDFYDYDNWKFSEKDSIKSRYIKILNNSAYIQQKSGELVPYVLYIPITIMQNEFEDIIKNGAKNF